MRNINTGNFTFRQNHPTGFIERVLDHTFISNYLQDFVNNTDIPPVLTNDDYYRLLSSFLSNESDKNGKDFWKFNNSLVYHEVYVE